MSGFLLSVRGMALVAASILATVQVASAQTKEFSFSQKANDRLAKKMGIPVYFAVPASARGALPAKFETSDLLVDFKHPDAKGAAGDVGLRLVVTKRSGMSGRLGRSGLIQTGDILLSFRTEWGGSGAYPNIQMGVSHTGIAYVKDGEVHNLDNPMNEEYLGSRMRGDLTGEHYGTLDYIHIIRPRNLTEAQKSNLQGWISRLTTNAKRIYPERISFNQDYNAPKYKDGKPYDFVKTFAEIALGGKPASNLDMFCSEFVWSILALRDCDPATSESDFKASGIPACVREVMKPMDATGDYIFKRNSSSYSGLADGPLLVVDALKLPTAERKKLLESIFVESPGKLAKLSVGHKTLAQSMQPKFTPLKEYYTGAGAGFYQSLRARYIRSAVNRQVPDNYSPTSYLVNTLLPADNVNRTMDYVATIVIE